MKTNLIAAVVVAVASLTSVAAHAGGTYEFAVRCQNGGAVVEEWRTGDIDPGREYLRVITGTKYPGCSVGEYIVSRDSHLPRNRHSHEGAILSGLPPVQILKSIFGL